MIEEYRITQEELSEIIHKSRSQITNTLRLLQLTPYTQKLLNENKITQGHAKILVGLDPDSEKLVADTIVGQKLSVRESEELVKSLKRGDMQKRDTKPASANETEAEFKGIEKIARQLQSLGIKCAHKKNKLTLTFRNEAQIKALSSILSED